jgi:hypothetical protein
MEQDILEYIEQLTAIEKRVLKIAKEHLETSFSIVKSIGFIEWLSNKEVEVEVEV